MGGAQFSPVDAAAAVLAVAEPAAAAAGAAVTVWEVAGAPRVWPWQDGHAFSHETTVQVDVRAGGKADAWSAATAVAGTLLGSLPRVRLVAGPAWLPDGDGGPRFVLRFAVTSRA